MASSATVGTAVIKLSFDGKGVKAELNGVTRELEATGQATGGRWGSKWAVAAGNLIEAGIRKVGSMVTNTMGSAISRIDQLNNFPKVMTALGYSADEADKSISKMDEALTGLPTSLDAMTADVQKLAATMGNLAEGEVNATSVGLGLNNMFLAGGKGTAQASAAMEQYNQMLGMGKVDMQSWRTMMDTAPGQLKQLSETLLGAGNDGMDLYEALQKEKVSMDDMNAAIVKLNEEGGENFASFTDQAFTATGGIATQLENIGNTMNKIVGAALQGNTKEIDKWIKQLADRVGAVAPTLIQGFTGAFGALIKAIPAIMKELIPAVMKGLNNLLMAVFEAIPLFVQLIVDATPMIVDGLIQLLNSLIEAFPTIIPQLIMAITNLVTTLAIQFTRPDFLQLILQAGLTLLMSIVQALPDMLLALVDALPQIIDNIISFLTDPTNIMSLTSAAVQLFFGLVAAVPKILGSLISAFGKVIISLWNGIKGFFSKFAADFGNFITGIFKNAINGVLAFIENFINMPIDILNGFIDVINTVFGAVGVSLSNIDRISLPRLAQGGIALNATTAIIGEAGKEAVLPLENNTDNWAGLLANTLVAEMERENLSAGGGVNIENQEFIINNQMDAEEIGRVMMQSIRRAA